MPVVSVRIGTAIYVSLVLFIYDPCSFLTFVLAVFANELNYHTT